MRGAVQSISSLDPRLFSLAEREPGKHSAHALKFLGIRMPMLLLENMLVACLDSTELRQNLYCFLLQLAMVHMVAMKMT